MSWENYIESNEEESLRLNKRAESIYESHWASWLIDRNEIIVNYDDLIEATIKRFSLDVKSRKMEFCDMKQQFVIYCYELLNKKLLKKHKSMSSISRLMKQDHATSLHLLRKRKPTLKFDENVKELNKFLKEEIKQSW